MLKKMLLPTRGPHSAPPSIFLAQIHRVGSVDDSKSAGMSLARPEEVLTRELYNHVEDHLPLQEEENGKKPILPKLARCLGIWKEGMFGR